MLTKSDNVEHILHLPHNGHNILTWSLNDPSVYRRFEIGAPSFERGLSAIRRAQEAGYPVRIRLDPVVPVDDWQEKYAKTIEEIFTAVKPEGITVGTLRFEEGFYRMRSIIFNTGDDLPQLLEMMEPMFAPRRNQGQDISWQVQLPRGSTN